MIEKSNVQVACNDGFVYEWINKGGVKWIFDRPAYVDEDGGCPLNQLADNECIFAPAAIYRDEAKISVSVGISKEKWKEIELALSLTFVHVHFKYKGYELAVSRVRVNENKTCLQVYIDGEIRGAWFTSDDDCTDSDNPTILKDVYKERSISRYSPSHIKRYEKIYGKRRVKKEFPNMHDKRSYLTPTFSKSSVLCRQYKKLDGLELVALE